MSNFFLIERAKLKIRTKCVIVILDMPITRIPS